MNINNIIENYGKELLLNLENDSDSFRENVTFLQKYRNYEMDDMREIVERYFPIFLYDTYEFRDMVINLFENEDTIEDITILEELL